MSDNPLRPVCWDDYIGQHNLKEELRVEIHAALNASRMLDHVLIAAPPGYGKTTLAQIIANELNDRFQSRMMPLEIKELVRLLNRWEGGVLLLDEIHQATDKQQHALLSLLEDKYIEVHGEKLRFPGLTIIGATTEPEKLIQPLVDRFPIRPRFDPYSDDELATIVANMVAKSGIKLDTELAEQLGRATGGTPRIAATLAKKVVSLTEAGEELEIDRILRMAKMDADGLSAEHLDYLKSLNELGGTAGIERISSMIRMHPSVVKELERLLITRRYVKAGPQGRELTPSGIRKAVGGKAMSTHRQVIH